MQMKNLFRSILLAFTLTFTLSFAVPQQVQACEKKKVTMATFGDNAYFLVFTYFYSCSGEYLGARADVYDSNGRLVGSYEYNEKNKRI